MGQGGEAHGAENEAAREDSPEAQGTPPANWGSGEAPQDAGSLRPKDATAGTRLPLRPCSRALGHAWHVGVRQGPMCRVYRLPQHRSEGEHEDCQSARLPRHP